MPISAFSLSVTSSAAVVVDSAATAMSLSPLPITLQAASSNPQPVILGSSAAGAASTSGYPLQAGAVLQLMLEGGDAVSASATTAVTLFVFRQRS